MADISTFFPDRIGFEHGRIVPESVTPADGDYVLSLGGDRPYTTSLFTPGDTVAYSQELARGTNNLLRMVAATIGVPVPVITTPPVFALADAETITFTSDGETEVVTLSTDDFVDIANATGQEVADVLARDLSGIYSVRLSKDYRVTVVSTQRGKQSEIVVGGTATLGFRRPRWILEADVEGVIVSREILSGDAQVYTDIAVYLDGLPASVTTTLKLSFLDADGVVDAGVLMLAELPGAYFDNLVFLTVSPTTLINRVPEPGHSDHPVGDNIVLEAVADAPIAIGDVSINVSINGDDFTAIDTGSFVAPFDGPESALTQIGPNHIGIVIDPVDDLPEQTEITVMFLAPLNGGAGPITYQFVTEDLTGPRIESLTALSKTEVVITFNEGVADDALDPANWTYTAVTLPAITPVVVSVVRISTRAVKLIIDTETSVGRIYEVAAESVDDTSGNDSGPISIRYTAPASSNSPTDRDFRVQDFVPDYNWSLDAAGDLRRFIDSLQDIVDVLLCSIDEWVLQLDPDTASEPVLDAMLCDLGNPFNFVLSENEKRKLIRVLVAIYRLKGTKVGIEQTILFFLGISVEVVCPFLETTWIMGVSEMGISTIMGSGSSYDKYSFYIVSPVELTDAQREQITSIAELMKPAHTHFLRIDEPTPPPPVVTTLIMGVSEMGINWIMN